ncbi:MAG: twin-arginine translocation signal domain-containing protein, partial [Kiritimatiellae bacterium]|nr:twin-arginine translocation signal domain-containing protein [Kiritimatiellia bacterium]
MTRRDFLTRAMTAAAAAGAGGCLTIGANNGRNDATRGVVVSARDLSGAFNWPRLAHEAGLTTIASHIGPRDVIPFMLSGRGARFLDDCARYGLQVEHELHAIDWLLPRTMFATDPAFFRMNEKGARTPDSNCCPSNPFALEVIACRAVEVARICHSTTGRYFDWMTDTGQKCNCRKCRELSGAEQAVIVENGIVRALRVVV